MDDNLHSEEFMDKVGVVGCGTMGTGICLAFASSGYSVKIVDTNLDMVLKSNVVLIGKGYHNLRVMLFFIE